MRLLSPPLFAGVLSLAALLALDAADPGQQPSATPTTPPTQQPAAMTAPDALEQSSETTEAASPIDAAHAPAPEAKAESAPSAETPPTAAAPAAEAVITAKIDPELALRLSLLEKTMLAQTQGQNQIYTETSRLLMFFGTACVAMGLIAMVAAVFLMNRTLASVSAITAQVAHTNAPPALASGGSSTLMVASTPAASGFEKVQASGQRFQNRMTSLEQRLEELEHLAGHAPATATAPDAVSDDGEAVTGSDSAQIPPPPRRSVPVSAILVRKAETLMNQGKLSDAMSALDEASKHEGDLSEVHLARGRVLEKMGRLGDALESYDLAASTDSGNTAALLMKAGVLNRQERFDEALSCYERALAVHRASV